MNAGASVNITNDEGKSSLSLAQERNDQRIVELLTEAGEEKNTIHLEDT